MKEALARGAREGEGRESIWNLPATRPRPLARCNSVPTSLSDSREISAHAPRALSGLMSVKMFWRRSELVRVRVESSR